MRVKKKSRCLQSWSDMWILMFLTEIEKTEGGADLLGKSRV